MEQPKQIGRYLVQSLLGEGAMGSVYKAIDPAIKRTVAIKTIKIDKSRSQEEQDEFLQRFFQEAQISGNLNHPNIVSIYDIGDENGIPYLAMEFVEGKTLNQLIKGSVRPGFESLTKAIVQVTNALTFAHRKGIVHRDLKPANIMITPDGNAKIMDFGIAKMSGSNLTQTGIFLGTPSYSSPEQVREGQVDHRSDIFSLGILAHEVLTGFTPFPGQNISTILYKIANEPPVPPPNLDDLPIKKEAWIDLFTRVLEKNPDKRLQNASQFGQLLLQCIKISATTTSELSVFFEEGPETVRQTIGVEKPIQRSEFESGTAKLTIQKQKPARNKVLLTVLIVFLISSTFLVLDAAQIIPENARVSQYFPQNFRNRFFPPREISKIMHLSSTPPDSKIIINGKEIATTPYEFHFNGKPGTPLDLKITMEGFETYHQSMVIDSESPVDIEAELVELPIKGTISSSPSGAEVILNGKKIGTTPLDYAFKKSESYEIELAYPEYNELTFVFNPKQDSLEKLHSNLKKIAPPGTIRLDSDFEDLNVKIAGRTRTFPVKLPAGTYSVELTSRKYFYTKSMRVDLESDKTFSIKTPEKVTISRIDFADPTKYAKVQIDGIDVEYTPISNLEIAKGLHSFKFLDENGNILNHQQKEVVDGSQVIVPN